MAVTRTEFLVNSGNTGWTSEQVLDALELALGTGGAGYHSGTSTSGVMRKLLRPTDGWPEVGGQIYPISNANTPTRNLSSNFVTDGTYWAEWDVQLSAPPGGTAATITVRRWGADHGSSIEGKVEGIYIRNGGSGYADDAVFTLASADIGGSTATDITFGVRSATVPAVKVHATKGGASNWWWKDTDSNLNEINASFVSQGRPVAGVCRLTNDANKIFGTTYYSFTVTQPHSQGTFLGIKSGPKWDDYARFVNYTWAEGYQYQGSFIGDPGMDGYGEAIYWDGNGDIVYNPSNYAASPLIVGGSDSDADGRSLKIKFARSVDPTDYPLKIVTYRAPATQDTKYTIFQFQQIVNGNVEVYGTFSLNAGTLWGQNIWDLDHVFQGGVTLYGTVDQSEFGGYLGSEALLIRTQDATDQYDNYGGKPSYLLGQNSQVGTGKIYEASARARECLFGYQRQQSGTTYSARKADYITDVYRINIDGHHGNEGAPTSDYYNMTQQYYRNDVYDRVTINGAGGGTFSVNALANSHKPLKGLPISSAMMPCPYYIPDDFVIIQFVCEPGETIVYPGDTISVSGSEVYTIVCVAGESNNPYFSNNNDLVGRYIVYAARTT
ncbi:hypothetical protein SBM3_00198 [Synechococcus phage S-BM3]|nr:hypothetical protein SBM3_00198 [Synechococcus phage S-BM3]